MSIRQAIILAGGRGTRLGSITDNLPKPMVDVNGEPFVSHLLRKLAQQGVSEVIFLTGYLGDQISSYFRDHHFDLEILFAQESEHLSTGERLLAASSSLDEIFLLLYSDNFALFDLRKSLQLFEGFESPLVLSVCRKPAGNIVMGPDSRVSEYLENRSEGRGNFVEVGFSVCRKEALISCITESERSLTRAIASLVNSRNVRANLIEHPYFSVSDPIRLEKTRKALSARKVILLDRDGVINRKVPQGEYVTNYSSFEKIESTWDALVELARAEFEFIVITNQAGIARGSLSKEALDEIHHNMIEEFRQRGISVLGVHVCPHHWDDDCECRKPKPGLFFQAAEEHSILLPDLIYVGDDVRDESAAIAAGCTPLIIGPDRLRVQFDSTMQFDTLFEALPYLVSHYQRIAHSRVQTEPHKPNALGFEKFDL